MIKTKVINEINKSYLEVLSEEDTCVDYRTKMLEANKLPCFLLKTGRCINGVEREYYDITGKESLLSFFNLRTATREELAKLFRSMAMASEEAEKLLIDEGNILFRPDCIFINSTTMAYEFICLPVSNSKEVLKTNIQSLLQFFLSKLDENDISLLKTMYSLFDKSQSITLSSRMIYNCFNEGINYREETVTNENTANEVWDDEGEEHKTQRYIPSVRELLAVFFVVTGTLLIGYETYIMMLPNM